MAKTTVLLAAILLSSAQPSFAQEENAWQKFLRDQRELTAKENAELKAQQAQSDREYRELQLRLRSPQPVQNVPTIKPIQPQVKPVEDPKSGAVLVNTINGMKQCRFVGGIAFCS